MCIYTHIYIYVYIYMCVCVYIYIYTEGGHMYKNKKGASMCSDYIDGLWIDGSSFGDVCYLFVFVLLRLRLIHGRWLHTHHQHTHMTVETGRQSARGVEVEVVPWSTQSCQASREYTHTHTHTHRVHSEEPETFGVGEVKDMPSAECDRGRGMFRCTGGRRRSARRFVFLFKSRPGHRVDFICWRFSRFPPRHFLPPGGVWRLDSWLWFNRGNHDLSFCSCSSRLDRLQSSLVNWSLCGMQLAPPPPSPCAHMALSDMQMIVWCGLNTSHLPLWMMWWTHQSPADSWEA